MQETHALYVTWLADAMGDFRSHDEETHDTVSGQKNDCEFDGAPDVKYVLHGTQRLQPKSRHATYVK